MYQVLLKKSAQKELEKLPSESLARIVNAIDELTQRGTTSSQIKKLHDPLSGFRKRIGNYRILFDIKKDLIIIHRISKRAEAYR